MNISNLLKMEMRILKHCLHPTLFCRGPPTAEQDSVFQSM